MGLKFTSIQSIHTFGINPKPVILALPDFMEFQVQKKKSLRPNSCFLQREVPPPKEGQSDQLESKFCQNTRNQKHDKKPHMKDFATQYTSYEIECAPKQERACAESQLRRERVLPFPCARPGLRHRSRHCETPSRNMHASQRSPCARGDRLHRIDLGHLREIGKFGKLTLVI